MNRLSILLSVVFLLTFWGLAAQSPDCFSLKVSSDYTEPGEQVCVEVEATGFQDILGLQFSMAWDPGVLQLEGITGFNLPGLSEANFGPGPVDSLSQLGTLTASWFDSELSGVSLNDGSALFTLCFTFTGDFGEATVIRFSNRPTDIEFFKADATLLQSFALISGTVRGVTPGPGPDLSIESVCTGPLSCTGQTGYAIASAADGTPPYSFHWIGDNGQSYSGDTVDDLAGGIYQLLVADQRGDTVNALVYNQQGGLAIDTVRTFAASCPDAADGSILVDVSGGTGGYRYLWSDGQTTAIATGLAPGEYSVTVSDSQDCSLTETITVPASDSLLVEASVLPAACGTASGSIRLSLPRPTDSLFTYRWSSGDTTATIDSLPAGSYTVTVTDDLFGCSAIRTFFLSEEALGIDLSFQCRPSGLDSLVDIQALVTNGGLSPYTFNWNNGAIFTDSVASVLRGPVDSTYALTVTDANGCSATLTDIRPFCPDSTEALLKLTIGNGLASPGEQVCLPVVVTGFTDVAAIQFGLAWDPAILRFEGVENFSLDGTVDTNFGFSEVDQGALRFAWIDNTATGVSLAEETTLFNLCFTALDSAGQSLVSFSDQVLPAEANNSSLAPFLLELIHGGVLVGDAFVWPGDTDDNGTVNHYDLLPIGLAFNAEGPPRDSATIDWQPQPAEEWTGATPSTGINFNHSDTDGNGRVDAADTLAIRQNWGQVRDDSLWIVASPRTEGGIPLFIAPRTVPSGQPAAFDIILGESEDPAIDVYGLAFSIVYDTTAIQETDVRVELDDSWLGTPGNDLLSLQRNHPAAGRLDIGITRIDQTDRSGNGSIGRLLTTIEDVILIRTDEEILLPFRIENVRVINAKEEDRPADPRETVSSIQETISSTAPGIDGSRIRLYPNPVGGELYIDAPGIKLQAARLYNLNGRLIGHWPNPQMLNLAGLPPGTYLLQLISPEGVASKRVIKN